MTTKTKPFAAARLSVLLASAAIITTTACSGAIHDGDDGVVPTRTAQAAAQIGIGTDAVGFDDVVYAPSIDRVLVPAGETGMLGLVDPHTARLETVEGFSKTATLRGGHTQGPTSSAMAADLVAVVDRTAKTLSLVDPAKHVVVTSLPLTGIPDYVRYEASRHELWVTEPEQEQIEIIPLRREDGMLEPTSVTTVDVPGGPESLVFDSERGHAYTNLWAGMTVAIDLETHALQASFKNGCDASRTLALDADRALLFVACSEGAVSSIDLSHGRQIVGRFMYRTGIDALAYDAARGLLYAPSAGAGSMAALSIGRTGEPTLAFEVVTARGASCVTVDGSGTVWLCDPAHGRLLTTPPPPSP